MHEELLAVQLHDQKFAWSLIRPKKEKMEEAARQAARGGELIQSSLCSDLCDAAITLRDCKRANPTD